MSYYFREKPRFGERFRGKSGDEILQELKQQFAEDAPSFFDGRRGGDPFERHTSFPRDFPFDEEGFGRRGGDIRAHLDDLAARHPEFADHLLGPPWADVPFAGGGGGVHRAGARTRRGSNDRSHNHPDEDARSQASGSSAASGASAASSHGEPEEQLQPGQQRLPQYGLRNTVDIGQQQHSMENPQHQRRDVRSMSAPPENRNGTDPQQRFVSRVEITPQAQQNQNAAQPQPQQQPQAQREKSPAPQQQKSQSQQQQGNVRHIPIFVEGRDEPVIPKSVDEPDFPKPRQQSPPQFQRPSAFQHHYNKQPSGWSSSFQDPFFDHSTRRFGYPPEHPQFRHAQQQERPRSQQSHYTESPPQSQRQKPQAHPQAQPQQKPPQQEAQPEAPPKPRQQTQPKDPLERVALVQKEVDALTEQVKAYTGNSRQDKQYMYLDEMLTRELIKLDDIETEGKDNVRQARKQAIKSIQDSISLLESKAPLPDQQKPQEEEMAAEPAPADEETKEQPANSVESSEAKTAEPAATEAAPATAESMETSEEPAPAEPAPAAAAPAATTEEPQQKAIPLPPPTSPTKLEEPAAPEPQASQEPEVPMAPIESPAQANIVPEQSEPVPAAEPMEVRQSTPAKDEPAAPEAQPQEAPKQEAIPLPEPPREQEKPKKEPPAVPAKPGKSPKKAKKTKQAKQPEPVSEAPIPLPAPGQSI